MNKQEGIKGGIKTLIFMEGSCGEKESNKLTDDILKYLHSKRVVIQVERELSDKMFLGGYGYIQGHQLRVLLDKLNLVPVIPIKEE